MDLDTKIQDDNFLNQHTWQDNIPTDFEGATDHIYEANDRDQHRTLVNRAMTSRVTLTTLNAMKSELNCLLQVSLTSETIFLRWKIPCLRPLVLLIKLVLRLTNLLSVGGMILQGKTEVLEENPSPVPLCPLQIPCGLIGDRTWFSAIRGRRLTVCAMTRPNV